MTGVLLFDNEEQQQQQQQQQPISTKPLTPPTTDDCNESTTPIPSPTGTFIDKEDAFLILKDTLNILPSPPPQELEVLDNKNKRKIVNIETDLDHKPQHDTPDCNWCQRCGTLETPRWRYGPAGPLSLCNACHLRWKAIGKPKDGYSSKTFPPPYHNVPKRKYVKSKKTKMSNNGKDNNTVKLEDSMIKLRSPPLPPPLSSPKTLVTSSLSSSTTITQSVSSAVIIPGNCTQCHTTETPLWRRGPQGYRTLCNACGLKWAKEYDLSSLPNPKKHNNNNNNLLFNQKQFIKHGLYSNETRIETPRTTTTTAFKFSSPIHQGEFLLSTTRDFELPPNILQERDLGLIKGIVTNRQPCYTRIRSNIFVERKPYKLNEPAVCHCDVPKEKEQLGCGEDCINRMLFYECDPASCPCGKQCSNQRFQRKEKKKGLQVFQTDHRGWGLKTNVDIKKGELVIEYRGEIISHQLCEERMCTTYVNEKNFYFLDYCNGEVIDACSKGTEARFINHSCDPNCHIEKWSVKGESHYGVFASKDIKAQTELFYDYNFSTFNGSVESQQRCHCGSNLCRGTIGKRGSAVARSK